MHESEDAIPLTEATADAIQGGMMTKDEKQRRRSAVNSEARQGSRKTATGKIRTLDEQAAIPRIKRFVFTYTFAETFAVDGIAALPPKRTRSKK